MQDLSAKIGLPITLEDDNRLSYPPVVDCEEVAERTFYDLLPVCENNTLDLSNDPAYFMYRNIRKRGDEKILQSMNLRFDLTVIPSGKIGNEFVKTFGHYHPKKPGTAFYYPELYFVLSGQATYLLQHKDLSGNADDVILVRADTPTLVVMPPGYGHVTINEKSEPLVMANWVEATFVSEYSEYENSRGAAYYLEDNFGKTKIVANPQYGNVPKTRELKSYPQYLLHLANKPIYQYLSDPAIESLTNVEKYIARLSVEQLFAPKT